MNKHKVLVFDIETAPLTASVWGLKDQNIGLSQIIQDASVLAWAAKWLGDPPSAVMYDDTSRQKDKRDDRKVLKSMWSLLDEADIVVTQNGKNFDSRVLNARFITQGMNPPSPYTHLDTYQIVRRVAKFTSNKLEYLTERLCTKYKKLSHKKFPGMSLWTACLAGNKKAWAEMKKYNIHDVLATEEFYTKIRAWAPETMPKPYVPVNINTDCPVCGSRKSVTKNGTRAVRSMTYQRLICGKCGSWSKGERIK